MATPGQLVKAVAHSLGVSPATITQFDRVLAENGLRSKGGRGTSAAKITATDAANLLLAVVGSGASFVPLKEAARICSLYGSLPGQMMTPLSRKNFQRFGLTDLANLPDKHSLGDALAVLVDGASRKQLFRIPVRGEEPLTFDAMLGIRFDGPTPWAEIIGDGSMGTGKPNAIARIVYCDPKKHSPNKEGDLHHASSFRFATIRALGSLLAKAGAA